MATDTRACPEAQAAGALTRDSTENALKCYREAAKLRAAGDELEALGLAELAEQSLDLARDVLSRLESLDVG